MVHRCCDVKCCPGKELEPPPPNGFPFMFLLKKTKDTAKGFHMSIITQLHAKII